MRSLQVSDLYLRHSRVLGLFLGLALLLLAGGNACRQNPPGPPEPAAMSLLTFESVEVTKGRIEESGKLTLSIMLPPSYERDKDRRYPVVYALHGWGMRPSTLAVASHLELEAAWQAGSCPELIMVGIPGTNRLGGSFYVDSPATGNWESMVIKEVVPLIDATYRTRPEPAARMIAGYSMGGYGAWNMALVHPEVFAHAWACCPFALAPRNPAEVFASRDLVWQQAFGAAFAPDLSLEYPYVRVPDKSDSAANQALVASWFDPVGNMDKKLTAYLTQPARLLNLRFAYSNQDENPWIVEGVKFVAQTVSQAGIPSAITGYDIYHTIGVEMVMDSFLPLVRDAFGR